jgi:hypothetical protein
MLYTKAVEPDTLELLIGLMDKPYLQVKKKIIEAVSLL